MEQYIMLIVCLLILGLAVISIFFADNIVRSNKIKNKIKFSRGLKLAGFVVCVLSLVAIYILNN